MGRVSERMKIDSILDLAVQLGSPLPCVECKEPLLPGQVIQFDHRQATIHDGPHTYTQVRPVHYDPCHKGKTKRDIQANCKVKRITGETGTRAEKFAVRKLRLDKKREPKPRYGNTTFRSTPR